MSRLHVSRFGQDSNGPVLVLLHGWGSSSKIWQLCIPYLSEAMQILCVDLPGHGKSHAIKWDGSVDQALALLLEILPAQCSIIGWSLGGLLAQLYAQHNPQRVQNLMLIASTPKFTATRDWPNAMPVNTFAKFVKQYDESPETTVKQFHALQALHGASPKQIMHALQQAATDIQAQRPEKIRWGLSWLEEIDLRHACLAEKLPVYLLQGENDQVSSMQAAVDTAEIWDQLNLSKVSSAGHLPFISHQNQFIEQVKTMLASTGKSSRV
ncbi:MAG: alpha/beta fold hydrolase [Gammaproteobacteria bacterium]